MAQTIKLKRSAQSGASGIPSTSDLALGEVGINTYHGKMYIKKDDGTESIVEVGSTGSFLPLSGGTLTGNLNLGDNVKAQFGAGDDLQIFHDGTNSYIDDAGSGSLILNGTEVRILSDDSSEYSGRFITNGAVELYYDSNKKFETKATGIDVTGSVVADKANIGTSTAQYSGTDLTVGDNADSQNGLAIQTSNSGIGYILFGDGSGASAYRGEINYSHSTDSMTLKTAGTSRLNLASNGDISFYNDSANQGLFWDSSTSRLGLGTTAPAAPLSFGANIPSNGQTIHTYHSGNTRSGLGIVAGVHRLFTDSGSVLSFGQVSTSDGSTYTERFKINADGSSEFSGAVTSAGLTLTGATGSVSKVRFQAEEVHGDIEGINIGANFGGLAFKTNTNGTLNTALTIDSSQNATFSGSVTSTGLTVNDSVSQNYVGIVENTNSTNGFGLLAKTAHTGTSAFAFGAYAASNPLMVVRGDGRTGINTDNPLFDLHVKDENTNIGIESTTTHQNASLYFRAHSANQWETGVNITAGLDYEIYDRVNNASRFVVGHSGNVNIPNGSLMVGSTTAPSTKLHVVGGTASGTMYDTAVFAGGANSTSGSGARIYISGCENDPLARGTIIEGKMIDNGNSHELNFYTSGNSQPPTKRLTIDSSGNSYFHGAGHTNLEVRSGSASTKAFIQTVQDSDVRIGSSTNHPVAFYANGQERLKINSSTGNINIGSSLMVGATTAPTAFSGYVTLHHKNPSGDAIHLIESDGGIIGQTFVNDASGVVTTGSRSNHPWRVTTNDTERMRIDSSGRLLVNSSSNTSRGGTNTRALIKLATGESYVDIQASSTSANSGLLFSDGSGGNFGLIDYAHASDSMLFYTASQERMRINSSGEVVITSSAAPIAPTIKHLGTTGYLAKLRIINRSGQSINKGGLLELGGITNDEVTRSDIFASVAGLKANASSNNRTGYMQFSVSNGSSLSEAMRIDSSGNLLVGKTSSSFSTTGTELLSDGAVTITRSGTAGGTPFFVNRLSNSGELIAMYQDSVQKGNISVSSLGMGFGGGTRSSDFFLKTDGTASFASGVNVGIGISSSIVDKLHLNGVANASTGITIGNNNSTRLRLYHNDAAGASYLTTDGMQTEQQLRIQSGSFVAFDNNGSESARLTSGGTLLVGTTGGATYQSTVNEGVEIAPDFIGVARNQNTVMHLNRQGNDGTIVDFRTYGFVRGSVSISGSTTSYNTSSDERLKDNIKDSDDSGFKVDAIQVRQFDWKADGEHQDYGMVAQELLEVAPDAVTQGDTPDDMMGVDYSKLVPMLIKEIQSLRQRVAQLEE